MKDMIKLENVTKIYKGELYETKALDNVSLKIENGEFVSIMGPSGSGKSTLLNIIGCMDTVTTGEYYLASKCVSKLKKSQLYKIRKKYIGFVFQHFALMDYYTAYENIELPMLAQNVPAKKRKKRITIVAGKLGITEILNKKPAKMSGGQRQRVAIARALVSDASVILADEPTGALDQKTGDEVLELLRTINASGRTVVIVTHDNRIAAKTNRIINICDGKVVSDVESDAENSSD
jgi:putative ABC transport system ATP-binding protein